MRWLTSILFFILLICDKSDATARGVGNEHLSFRRRRSSSAKRQDNGVLARNLEYRNEGTASSIEEKLEIGATQHIPRTGTVSFGRVQPVSSYSTYRMDEKEQTKLMAKSGYRPWTANLIRKPNQYSLTAKITLFNCIAYGIQVLNPSFTQWGIKLSDRILRGQELYRLVTPMFLHGGIAHLMMNTYSLQAVGPDVEGFFGPGRFLATYAMAGVAGNLMSAINSPNPALGASGAVFGIVGAYYVFLSRNRRLFGRQGANMQQGITRTIAVNLFLGAMNPMVDNWGHIGGAVGGAAMAYYFGPRLYMAGLPNGGRTIVDKPVLRLPRSIESIPDQFLETFRKMKRRMQVDRYMSDLPVKPWRPKQNNRRVIPVPNRSIRPAKKFSR